MILTFLLLRNKGSQDIYHTEYGFDVTISGASNPFGKEQAEFLKINV